jgi:hypothetical protein
LVRPNATMPNPSCLGPTQCQTQCQQCQFPNANLASCLGPTQCHGPQCHSCDPMPQLSWSDPMPRPSCLGPTQCHDPMPTNARHTQCQTMPTEGPTQCQQKSWSDPMPTMRPNANNAKSMPQLSWSDPMPKAMPIHKNLFCYVQRRDT